MNICYLLSSICPHVRAWGTGGRGHAGAVERTVQALAKARDAGAKWMCSPHPRRYSRLPLAGWLTAGERGQLGLNSTEQGAYRRRLRGVLVFK